MPEAESQACDSIRGSLQALHPYGSAEPVGPVSVDRPGAPEELEG